MLRLMWVFAARNNQHIAFLRSLGKAIGAIGLSSYCLGVVFNLLPIFEWLRRQSNGQAHNRTRIKGQTHNGTRATSLQASDKKRRSLKWFFWDLWFVCPDVADSELISNNNTFLVGTFFQLAMISIGACPMLFLPSPPEGSSLEAAIQENNATFLSMATFADAVVTSSVVAIMFDASLVLIGRTNVAECQNEIGIVSCCTIVAGFLPLRNGVIENFPQFIDMMMGR
jgi:hypothetical protein